MPKHPEVYDSGVRGEVDSGGAVSLPDAGLEGRQCATRRAPLPEAVLPRCRASTRVCVEDCLQAADGDACREACLQSDDTPAESMYGLRCDSCVYLQLFACIDQAQCHDAVAAAFCCFEDECPIGSPEGCSDERCGAQIEEAATCGYYSDMTCLDYLSGTRALCYAERD